MPTEPEFWKTGDTIHARRTDDPRPLTSADIDVRLQYATLMALDRIAAALESIQNRAQPRSKS